jgi:hypothetical protein
MEMMIDEPLLIAGAVMLLKQIERTNGGDQTGESKLHRTNMFGADFGVACGSLKSARSWWWWKPSLPHWVRPLHAVQSAPKVRQITPIRSPMRPAGK